MRTLMTKLRRTGLMTLPGLLYSLEAALTTGAGLAMLLRVAARLHPERTAIVDERGRLRYDELWRQAEVTAVALHAEYGLRAGQRVGIACRNHMAAVAAIFACSRLGAHVYLVNPEMSGAQILALVERERFELLVYDEELGAAIAELQLPVKALPAYGQAGDSVDQLAARYARADVRLPRAPAGNLVVMTSGTTGRPKAAGRRPSLLNSLPPFLALLAQAQLDSYRSIYVAPPIYHGYGLAMLFLGLGLGAELHVSRRFDAARACERIARHQVEAMIVVPLMLQRMLGADPGALAPLRCVIVGSAPLSPALAGEAIERLGPVLFNLYGTSEAGFAFMAGPETLRAKPGSIGKPLPGVRARIVDTAGRTAGPATVGRLCIRSAWTVDGQGWIETGDLASCDGEGDLLLCGRVDDMIVSGGENVYPVELERILLQHPEVEAAAVVGIADSEFGQRLKAVVVPRPGVALDRTTLLAWLRPRVARYQMPAVLELRDALPYTALGKLDKRSLIG